MADLHPPSRRIKAAMELASISSAEDLADAIGERGLGASTLRKFLRGERTPRRAELLLIAEAVELPYEFFTADLATAFGSSPDLPSENRDRIDRLEQTVEAILDHLGATAPAADGLPEIPAGPSSAPPAQADTRSPRTTDREAKSQGPRRGAA